MKPESISNNSNYAEAIIEAQMKCHPANEEKVIVITGATSGIGLATVKELAGSRAYIIAVGRSEERCRNAEQEVRELCPGVSLTYLAADLSSLAEVSFLASEIRSRLSQDGKPRIDVLINNAGTVSSWYVSTVDGFELQFAVNHLAPFLLTHELLPLLEKSQSGTVICISSGSHYRTKMRWNDIMLRKHYNTLLAYKQTKLANVLFVTELNRLLSVSRSKVKAFAVDPGLVNTDIGLKGTGGIVKKVWQLRSRGGTPPEQPARSVAYLVTDPAPRLTDEVYWKDCRPLKPSTYSQRPDAAKRLWELSERMCGVGHGMYGISNSRTVPGAEKAAL